MEYLTPNFTKEMLKTHTILIPDMAPIQFSLLKAAMESEGYHVELLHNAGNEAAKLGLKYVHNDTCYPALLIIGQFLDALQSGKYDLDRTALLITQTGGGCRASNYIKLLRKALVKAGYGNIPVVSLNTSHLEAGSSMPLSMRFIKKVIAAIEYGDEICSLRNQIKPYEVNTGETEQKTTEWIETISSWIHAKKNINPLMMKKKFLEIAGDFAKIPKQKKDCTKVGIVGEIYVKFSPLGNNHLLEFLEQEGCEVNLPGLMGFIEYCIANYGIDFHLYGGNSFVAKGADLLLGWLDNIGKAMNKAMNTFGFYAPGSFHDLMQKPDGILHLGAKMGEGWLLTAEMVELIAGGYTNIVCAQPFGCLPNHIAGKGVIKKIREKFPDANITPIDYDPSATKVNQENRIKLMLAIADET